MLEVFSYYRPSSFYISFFWALLIPFLLTGDFLPAVKYPALLPSSVRFVGIYLNDWFLNSFSRDRSLSFDSWLRSVDLSFERLNFVSYISNFLEDVSVPSRLESVGLRLLFVTTLPWKGFGVLTERLLSTSESAKMKDFWGRFLRLPLIGIFCK